MGEGSFCCLAIGNVVVQDKITAGSDIRVVLFCCDGLYQRDLMRELSKAFSLQAVVLQLGDSRRVSIRDRLWPYRNPRKIVQYISARTLRASYEQRAATLREELFDRNGPSAELPEEIPIIRVTNINDSATAATLDVHRPDVVCVSGTQLIRNTLRERAASLPLGMINLHTGLSPYTRGGNCNLFALLEGHPELVGITIHHIDGGIDRGDIIITDRPELSPNDNYEMIEAKTFRLGNDRMIDAVLALANGTAKRVTQWTEGKLYLKRTGYIYEPYLHVQVNRLLAQGLIADYLARRHELDATVRLIGIS
jgi:methionyl-tRNA formyltransferase